MHRWTGSALVQVMACRLDGAKPLFEPMLTYCQLDHEEYISRKLYLKFKYFHSKKYVWTWCLRKWRPFCPGGDELMLFWHQIVTKLVLISHISIPPEIEVWWLKILEDKTWENQAMHDNIIIWKYFLCYGYFVRGIHLSTALIKGQWCRA